MYALMLSCLYARGPTTVYLSDCMCSTVVVSTLVQTQEALRVHSCILSWHRRPYVCTDVVVSHEAVCAR